MLFIIVGYAHVSTYGQSLDVQLEQLRAANCSKIYRKKVTGARPTGASFSNCSPPSPLAMW
jgi:DNA invertase Pin-like site-specific DNA recombinase